MKRFVRPKIIGTLKINKMMAGNLAVVNGIKNSQNKIIIPCENIEKGTLIINKINNAKPSEIIYL